MDKGYSACIEMLFKELDFPARAIAARDCGYAAVEFWQWHEKPLGALADTGVPVLLALIDSMDEKTRDMYAKIGMLRRQSAPLFAEMLDETLDALASLEVKFIVATPGQAQTDISRGAQEDNIVECLRAAIPVLKKHGAELMIEPLNQKDHAGCYLSYSDQAFRIARTADDKRVGVLFDIYHQQVTEGDLISRIRSNIEVIKHFHVADVPGRHEIGTGEINYPAVIGAIRGAGYGGYIGCEFIPTSSSRLSSEGILKI